MKLFFVFLLAAMGGQDLFAQRSEVGLLLGVSAPRARTPELRFTRGTTLSANYGLRLREWKTAALYFEAPFLATPQHRIESGAGEATRDIATIYLTPGLRLKFAPKGRISPYVAGGGGWALFEQSTLRLDGRANEAPRTLSRGAMDIGGGVDVRVWRFLRARGEVRSFVSGNAGLNTPVRGSRQQTIFVGGGLAFGF
ncbi:MAG: hypothetical protein JNK48_08340 [Bryobacterales bacterium]|nr:hypothetical protein [Bryobacterales bacterium]